MNMAIRRTVSYIGLPAELTLLHRLKGVHVVDNVYILVVLDS